MASWGGLDTIENDRGEMFCRPHRSEYCHVCTCDFRGQNAYARGEIGVDEIFDYGEDTYFEAAQALQRALFMPDNEALGLRREAQANMLRRVGGALDAEARARGERLLTQQVTQAVAQERTRREQEAAQRAAVLASWEVEPLPASSGGGGGGKKKNRGGGNPKKAKRKKNKQPAQPKPAASTPAGAAAAAGGGGAAAAVTASAEAKRGEASSSEEEEVKEKQEKEEPVDLMAQHDDDCAICLISMQHTPQEPTVALRCQHQFHIACIKPWKDTCTAKRYTFTCPYCKDDSSKDMTF